MGSLTELQQKLLGDVNKAIESSSDRRSGRLVDLNILDASRLRLDYELALRLSEATPTAKALDDFSDAADLDVVGWLLDVPFELAKAGMVVEATHLQQVWAGIDERANFLGDRAVLLAKAGMKEEAVAQIAELNKDRSFR